MRVARPPTTWAEIGRLMLTIFSEFGEVHRVTGLIPGMGVDDAVLLDAIGDNITNGPC